MNNAKLDIIFTKLKILSKVEPGEKIIIRDHTIEVVDFSTYNLARVRKWYLDETRVSIRQKLKEFYRDIEDWLVNERFDGRVQSSEFPDDTAAAS